MRDGPVMTRKEKPRPGTPATELANFSSFKRSTGAPAAGLDVEQRLMLQINDLDMRIERTSSPDRQYRLEKEKGALMHELDKCCGKADPLETRARGIQAQARTLHASLDEQIRQLKATDSKDPRLHSLGQVRKRYHSIDRVMNFYIANLDEAGIVEMGQKLEEAKKTEADLLSIDVAALFALRNQAQALVNRIKAAEELVRSGHGADYDNLFRLRKQTENIRAQKCESQQAIEQARETVQIIRDALSLFEKTHGQHQQLLHFYGSNPELSPAITEQKEWAVQLLFQSAEQNRAGVNKWMGTLSAACKINEEYLQLAMAA